jgi:hypothetical protein
MFDSCKGAVYGKVTLSFFGMSQCAKSFMQCFRTAAVWQSMAAFGDLHFRMLLLVLHEATRFLPTFNFVSFGLAFFHLT